MTRHIAFEDRDLDERKRIIEGGVRLARVLDNLDRPVPHGGDGAAVADRNDRRKAELLAMIPAFGDDFGADPGGIAKRDRHW